MAIPYDREDQLQKIQSLILNNETIYAVYDAIGVGTGFIGITNKRIILQDNSFVGGKSAITSIPHSRVSSVSISSNKSALGKFVSKSEIYIHVGQQIISVEFRGDDKARHAHDLICSQIL